MLDAQRGARLVKGMLTGRFFFLAGKAVRKLAAVVGQDLLDFHRGGLFEPTQEVGAAPLGLVVIDAQLDPPCCPVDGHEQIAALFLIRHFRPVLDVDMQEAWLIVFEGLLRRLLALNLGLQALEIRDAMPT